MALKLTKGGLEQSKIINLSSGVEVPCMFNPFEYTLTKQNSWEKKPVKGKNVPQVTFKQGGSQILKLTVYFDSQQENADVRKYTDPLWEMMMVDDKAKNARSDKSQPPEVAFEWGRLYFKAVLTNMSQKFTLFDEKGTPVRCQVDLTLEQMIDVDDYKGSSSPSKVVAVVADQRLDHIAAAASTPTTPRQIAEKNNLNNLLNIPPGTNLTT